MSDPQVSQWIEAIIEESFKPCGLDGKTKSAVNSLLTKYNEWLVRGALQKAVRQAKGLARQEDRQLCDVLNEALDKGWLAEICESYANPMID